MDNWYSIYEMGMARHRAFENEYTNPHLIRAYALKDKEKKKKFRKLYRRILSALGRLLETWGRVLQKKFQTC